MGHDVKYYGKLTPKNPLNEEEIKLFKELKGRRDYDYLYALEYRNNGYFENDNSCEKVYSDSFYSVIEKYVNKLKEGGNDLIDGSYLVSCSEYGIDDEAIVLVYKNGAFIQKGITDLVREFVKVDV